VDVSLKVKGKRQGREAAVGQMEETGISQHEANLWEEIFRRDNLLAALARVQENKMLLANSNVEGCE
jgi:hypothetical protein